MAGFCREFCAYSAHIKYLLQSVLVFLPVCSEKASELSVQSFRLSIGLGMIAGGKADVYVEKSK